MPTPDDLSSLPPATLQAALSASKKRVRREKEKLQTEIRKLQKQLNQLDEGPDTSETEEVEVGRDVVGESQHKAKRQKIESPSDDGAIGERYSHWPIAKVRNVDPEPISSQRPPCSRCRREGLICRWDEDPKVRTQRCLACQRTKLGCDSKRPLPPPARGSAPVRDGVLNLTTMPGWGVTPRLSQTQK